MDKNSGGTVTGTKTYYPAGGAMRINSTPYYILKDHLGSASVLTDANGVVMTNADVRYYPFGEARASTTPMLTDKLFTGQREITGSGIYHYGARFYSPKLGRFLSADTMTSNPDNPQRFNHYTYGLNNPLRYSDPTGHRACDDVDEAGGCITAPGGGGMGFGGTQPKKPRRDGGDPSTPNPSTDPCAAGNFSPRCPGWHFYRTTNIVCPAELHCSAEEMRDWFLRFAFPGQDPSEPVVSGSSYSVSFCINDRCLPMGQYGAIRVDVSGGGFTTTNTTLATHILYNGQVVRHLSQGEDGAWYVNSYEFGNNATVDLVTPGPPPGLGEPNTIPVSLALVNDLAGPQIFNNSDYQMLQTILLNH